MDQQQQQPRDFGFGSIALPGMTTTGTGESPASNPTHTHAPSNSTQHIIDTLSQDPTFKITNLSELSSGGMGVVLTGYHTGFGKQVAIKVPLPHLVMREDALQRFLSEAQQLEGLSNPNIVTIRDTSVAGPEGAKLPYYTMELLNGEKLEDLFADLRGKGAIPLRENGWRTGEPREALQYIVAIAYAVEHMHSRGLVHRDLKPSNVMLHREEAIKDRIKTRRIIPKVIDLGIVKRLDDPDEGDAPPLLPPSDSLAGLTTLGQIVGTPAYMAPEQARGGKITPATDVYGLGGILHELLYGAPPAERELRASTLVSKDLAAIVDKALAEDPDRRYSSAQAFAQDLESFLANRPPRALQERQPLVARTSTSLYKAMVRNPLRSSLIALAAIGAPGAGSTAWSWSVSAQKQREALVAEGLKRDSALQLARTTITESEQLVDRDEVLAALAKFSQALDRLQPFAGHERIDIAIEDLERRKSDLQDYKKFIEMSRDVFAKSLNTFELGKIASFAELDGDVMRSALKTFLPDGATPAGLEAFEKRWGSSSYTTRQREYLKDAISTLLLLRFGKAWIDEIPPKTVDPEKGQRALAELAEIQAVMNACVIDGKPTLHDNALLMFKGYAHKIVGTPLPRSMTKIAGVTVAGEIASGLKEVTEGDYRSASGRFPRASRDTPFRLVTSNLAGHCFARLALDEKLPEKRRAHWLQAIRFFDVCIREDPSNPFLRAHYARAGAKLAIEELSFAKSDRFLENEGMKGDFIAQFLKCLELCGNNQITPIDDLRIELAVTFTMMGRPNEALEALGDIQLDPQTRPRETLVLLQSAAVSKLRVDLAQAELAFESSPKAACDHILFASILDISSAGGSQEIFERVIPLIRQALTIQPETQAVLQPKLTQRFFPASHATPEFKNVVGVKQQKDSNSGED
jgi:serine/threonine protein kinase